MMSYGGAYVHVHCTVTNMYSILVGGSQPPPSVPPNGKCA